MERDEILSQIIFILGDPYNTSALEKYMDLCFDQHISSEYTEQHHILPRCIFPNYKNTKLFPWNIVNLSYAKHLEAHQYLAESYPIRPLMRPLNFMLKRIDKQSEKYHNLLSEAAKTSWLKFKNDEKSFAIWRDKKSELMKLRMQPGGDLYEFHSGNKLSENRKKQISQQFKSLWKNNEYRTRNIDNIKKSFTQERRKQISQNSKNRWLDETYRINVTNKLTPINKDLAKRMDAGKKIKLMWEDPEFRNKQILSRKNRYKQGGKTNSEKLKSLWSDPIWKEKMLKSRREHHEAKKYSK